MHSHIHQDPIVQKISTSVRDAFLVGGCIRDLFLGRSPVDFDVVALNDPEQTAARIAATTGGHLIQLGKPGFDLYRIILDDVTIDVQGAKGATIEEDLQQRDFTINALACPIGSGSMIDIHDGRRDIDGRIIRMTSETVFPADPVRLIRAYRMAAVLDFNIEPKTRAAITKHSKKIGATAGERIRDDLCRLLNVADTHRCIRDMAESGLLFAIFPELSLLSGCSQNRYHRQDAWDHTLKTLKQMDRLIGAWDRWPSSLVEPMGCLLTGRKRRLLKLSVLLHDMGKPATKTESNTGAIHFFGHEKKGASAALPLLERLKLSNRDRRFVIQVVRHHLDPLLLYLSDKKQHLTKKGIFRFFSKTGDMAPIVLLHALADQSAKRESPENPFDAFVYRLLKDYFIRFQDVARQPPLITGHDLIEEFNLAPSPLFADILNRVEKERLTQGISTRDDALLLARRLLRGTDNPSGP